MAAKTQYIAYNRASRLLTARLRKLHEETKLGNKNPEEAARLRAAFDAIRPDIKRAKELNHNRSQALASHSLTIAGATAREMLKSMSKVELRAALPSLIERANAGEKEALTFLGAAVGVISNMPAEDRPITITKLARLVNLPDYDVAAAEIHEANFFLEAADRMLPRLEAGQLPTTQDIMVIGAMRRELDGGGGWRDFATLADANAELRLNPNPEEPNAPEPDSAEHTDAENPDGSDHDRNGDQPPAREPAPTGEGDANGADQARPEGAEGAQ